MEKREIIGEIGSRSFYMRKKAHETEGSFVGTTPVRTTLISSSNLIGSYIAQLIGKIMRRTRQIWNILVCVQWDRDQSTLLSVGHNIFSLYLLQISSNKALLYESIIYRWSSTFFFFGKNCLPHLIKNKL